MTAAAKEEKRKEKYSFTEITAGCNQGNKITKLWVTMATS